MIVQRKQLTIQKIVDGLKEIHAVEAQEQLGLEYAKFYVEALHALFGYLNWQPIEDDNLPQLGDEILGDYVHVANPDSLKIDAVKPWHIRNVRTKADYSRYGFHSFRPIHPPALEGYKNEQR